MPPIAVAIPIYLMYRTLGLTDTWFGMILPYTAVNVSLATWLMKGFMDEIPREYEEAALVDGYARVQAFRRVVLPQARTGIAATAIFCLIFAWNEYAFAVLLTSGKAQSAPLFIPTIIGEGGFDWPAVGAGATLFLLPIMVFIVLLRRNLLLERITIGVILAGLVMLMQPFSIVLYGWSCGLALTGRLPAIDRTAALLTAPMHAARALFLGARSIGHVDPGAYSAALMVSALCAS